jgi:GTP:adenosylcobinamide-phosphate guanylyltransferase
MSADIDAVVLAGGTAKPALAAAMKAPHRALAVVDGRTMLDSVVSALRYEERIARIAVVGSMPESPDYALLPDAGSFVANVLAGAEWSEAERLLVSSCDIPYITAEAVHDFLEHALRMDADIVYPVADVAACTARFPRLKRTSVRLKEGRYTGGNMMLFRREFLLRQRGRIEAAYAARKSPLRLASMLGFVTLLRLAAAQTVSASAASIPALERAAGRLLGGTARAYITPFVEIATDLDKPEDFAVPAAL